MIAKLIPNKPARIAVCAVGKAIEMLDQAVVLLGRAKPGQCLALEMKVDPTGYEWLPVSVILDSGPRCF
jgi:hypothetical protein